MTPPMARPMNGPAVALATMEVTVPLTTSLLPGTSSKTMSEAWLTKPSTASMATRNAVLFDRPVSTSSLFDRPCS